MGSKKTQVLYLSGLLGPRVTRELMEETGAGLESILFSIGMKLDRLDETISRARCRLEMMGNPSLVLHGPFLDLNPISYDALVLEATRARFAQAYEAAVALGAKKIVFHSGFVPATCFADGWAARAADFWNRFTEKREGIQILVENVFDPDPEPLAELAASVGHPDFGLCLDLGHAHCYGNASAADWADTLAGLVRHVHLHDNDGTADQHLALGEGSISFEEIIPRLLRQREDISWTIECAEAEQVRRSAARFREILSA